MWRRRLAITVRLCALALAVPALGGNDCQPARPEGEAAAEPHLVDDRGDVDSNGFAALVESVERPRGLHFVRRPELVLIDPSSRELTALAEEARALSPILNPEESKGSHPGAEAGRPGPPHGSDAPRAVAFPDFGRAQVVATSPPDAMEVRRALGRLLDAQQYPRLADAAPRLPGDAGIAIRALLAVSANAAASGSWFRNLHLPEADAPLKRPTLEGTFKGQPVFDSAIAPLQAGALLLLALDDPETAFRRPPLSTKQLISPAAYLASDRPIRLVGRPPVPADCPILEDASVGVLRLLLGLSATGGSVAGETLASWKGDRLIQLACEDGRGPWIYVIEFARESAARDFEGRADALLPQHLARPTSSATLGRRVAAWSGMDPKVVTAFARALVSHEVHSFEEWLP